MSMSTFQKVTLFSCIVLCVSLLLPKILLSRGKKDVGHQEVVPGRFPPMMHRQQMSDGPGQWGTRPPNSKAYNPDDVTKGKGVGAIGKGGGKSNLMGRIIPIYGFGILLYILYILFKITSKGKNVKADTRFPALKSENMKRKITDYELAQLQEKLKETEEVMEKIVSNAGDDPDRIQSVAAQHEEELLHQLQEITRVMQEGKLVEGVSLDSQAGEPSYAEEWEEDPEEAYPPCSSTCCRMRHSNIGEQDLDGPLPTAEELADGMRKVAEEVNLESKLHLPGALVQDTLDKWEVTEGEEPKGRGPHSGKQVGVLCHVRGNTDCIKEEDPVKMERMSFCSSDCVLDEAEGFLHVSGPEERGGFPKSEITAELGFGVLRKRGKRETE